MHDDFGSLGRPTGPRPAVVSGARPAPAIDRVVIGIAGARQNAAVAVCADHALLAFCEQERVTRVRRAPLAPGQLPGEALQAALGAAGCPDAPDLYAYATADDGTRLPSHLSATDIDHHLSHATAAFRLSSFASAAVLVCDRRGSKPLSVWIGTGDGLVEQPWPASGDGLAHIYAEAASLFGLPPGQEHELEGLARLDTGAEAGKFDELIAVRDGAVHLVPGWKPFVAEWLAAGGSDDLRHRARVASALQRHLGDLLVQIAGAVQQGTKASRLCLGGGLFYNTYLTTRLRQAQIFDDVSTAPNPGNAGTAIGAALAASAGPSAATGPVSPFLGPAYDAETIKRTLDNCKLSYEHLNEHELVETAAEALARGQLVGWFQGRMEWAHRALGNRSILASPRSPYVLDNLNVYLKHRARHRAYGVSVREEDASRYFSGPPTSRFMEYEYQPLDPEALRFVLPEGATHLRVQTVPKRQDDPATERFRLLHERFGLASTLPVLVNTSFNGFAEPMVCSPRDAIRVFFGTGLDLLVLDQFVIRK
jgi:carbamoyltransferase